MYKTYLTLKHNNIENTCAAIIQIKKQDCQEILEVPDCMPLCLLLR